MLGGKRHGPDTPVCVRVWRVSRPGARGAPQRLQRPHHLRHLWHLVRRLPLLPVVLVVMVVLRLLLAAPMLVLLLEVVVLLARRCWVATACLVACLLTMLEVMGLVALGVVPVIFCALQSFVHLAIASYLPPSLSLEASA